MTCPKCQLINPPSTEWRDCAYDFPSEGMQDSHLTQQKGSAIQFASRFGRLSR